MNRLELDPSESKVIDSSLTVRNSQNLRISETENRINESITMTDQASNQSNQGLVSRFLLAFLLDHPIPSHLQSLGA